MEDIIVLFVAIVLIAVMFVPVSIAKTRKIPKEGRSIIMGLTLLSLIIPPLWIIALLCSLCMKIENKEKVDYDNFERLERLYNLFKKKVITKEEYEKERSKILG